MTRTNKQLDSKYIGVYNSFLYYRYIFDVMNIDSNNTLFHKIFKNNNENLINPDLLQKLLNAGYSILLDFSNEILLVHKTYKSYILITFKISHFYCSKFKNSEKINALLIDFEKSLEKKDNVYFLVVRNAMKNNYLNRMQQKSQVNVLIINFDNQNRIKC